MVDWYKLPPSITDDLTERGLTPLQVSRMTPVKVLEEYLCWNGIINWGPTIYHAVHVIDNAAKEESDA